MAEKLSELFEDSSQPAPAAPVVTEANVEAPPAPAVVPVTEPPKTPEAPKPEPVMIPLAAALDDREKRQKLQKEFDDYRARHPEQAPSVPSDPNELAAHIQAQTERAIISARFDDSEERALEKHKPEEVAAAKDWAMARCEEEKARFGTSPFAAQYVHQKHPIDWAVRQHKRERLVSELGDDPDAWVRKRYAELNPAPASPASPQGAPAPAAPQPVAPPKPAAPSPSLASAPSAGSPMTNVAPANQVVERLFGKT